ncbi:MAG TPA: RodZ domain-containing protein [Candidatus Acidoferrales bacterium]|nr:RodZ domain-containing protein [Candidatus Acidoferrales bacterium]
MKQFGRYEVLEEIGSGAMGAVFKARDPMMDREVAVKTIHASALIGPMADQYRERFTREARAAGRLAHPGIVTVFDAGVEGDTPYLAMEFVPGRTLESVLSSGEHFPLERVYEIGQQLAEALAYAHANGVIHRDIKPANIQLTGSPERAKIMDFGVAKLTQAQVTSTGTLLGTPAYMAPEQFTGMPLDGRSDLFSLGVILYWLATGDKPFTGDTITAVSYKIVHTEPIAPRQLNPGVPAALEAIILKCLSKDPAARHQTGDELAADLAALRTGLPPASSSGIRVSPPAGASPGSTISSVVTVPLGASAQMRRSAIDAQASPPAPPAATGGVARTAPPAAPRPPAPEIPRRVTPAPQPQGSSAKVWLYALAVLVVLGVLWGATVAKRKKEQEAAAMAASQQQAAPPPALPAAQMPDTTTSSTATPTMPVPVPPPAPASAGETKAAAPARRPAAAKEEKPAPPPATEPQPDISGFALRLEVSASAPCSVEITTDDNPSQMHSLRAGESLRAGAAKIFQVRTDNAGALHLKLNGRDMPELGPPGSPRTVRLTARNLEATQPLQSVEKQGGGSSAARGVTTGKTQVDMEVTNLPKFADLTVWVDGQLLFQRAGSMLGGADSFSRVDPIPPGAHTISVFIGNDKARKGVKKQISGDFSAGQRRTLRVQSHFEGRRAPGMFQFDLSLE